MFDIKFRLKYSKKNIIIIPPLIITTINQNYELSISREEITDEHKRRVFKSLLQSVNTGTGSDEAMESTRIAESTKTDDQLAWEKQYPLVTMYYNRD